ncbi:Sak single strand annealing protein [Limosilactobacillus mucosae]
MSDEKKKSVFETLSAVDVSKHVEVIKMKKGPALSYVSWSWAWNFVKSIYPDTPTPKFTKYKEMALTTAQEPYKVKYGNQEYTKYRTVVKRAELIDREVPYLTTMTGTMVECTITIEGEPYTESLYVMDNNNNAVINPTMKEINKTQKRCLVKALALAGLGLSIYAGEDLPMADINEADKQQAEQRKEQVNQQRKMSTLQAEYKRLLWELTNHLNGDGKQAEERILSKLSNGQHSWQDAINAAKACLSEVKQND